MTNVSRWTAPFALILAIAVAPSAFAQMEGDGESYRPRFEVTPWIGYRAGGSFDIPADEATGTKAKSIDLDDGTSYGIDLGLYRDDHSFYELLYSRQQSGLDSSVPSLSNIDVDVEYL